MLLLWTMYAASFGRQPVNSTTSTAMSDKWVRPSERSWEWYLPRSFDSFFTSWLAFCFLYSTLTFFLQN